MSTSESRLTVRVPDGAAEISVLDSGFNTVAKSVGGLEETLPRGLYKIRLRVGPSLHEQLIFS